MSTTIDTNVVQMKFDNSQFERNVAQSMGTLDKLKQKITESTSGSALKGLQKAMSENAIDTKGINSALDSLQKRFSALGVAGMTIVSELTKSIMGMIANVGSTIKNLIYTGGLNRALNIEQARFQILGLKKDWNALSEDIDYAVSGTAYGFDAAAKAAAQLSASGIEAGDAMKAALRGISGVAAMANVSYEEISPIFTTVAGQGKLMTMQLRQLEMRGLNVAATLGEQLGHTEAEIRDMVSQDVISFEMFSAAMDAAFGEHAKDANKTFTGVIANIRAAFARIGADFISPIVMQESPIVLMLQKVREKVVDVKEQLQPLVKLWVQLVTTVGNTGKRIVSAFDVSKPMHVFYDGLHVAVNVAEALYRILLPIGQAFKDIFPKKTADDIFRISNAIVEFSEKLRITDRHMEQLKTGFKGVFSILKIVTDGIMIAIKSIFGLTESTGNLSDSIFDVIEAIGIFLQNLSETIRGSELVRDTFTGLRDFLIGIATAIGTAFNAIGMNESEGLTKFAENLKKATGPAEIFTTVFKGVFSIINGVISAVVPRVMTVLGKFGSVVRDTFNALMDAFGNGSGQQAMTILNSGLLGYLLMKFKDLVGSLSGLVVGIKGGAIANLLNQTKNALFAWQKDLEADALLKLAGAVAVLVTSLVMLTGIPQDELAASVTVISGLFTELAIAMKFMTGLTAFEGKGIGVIISQFTAMAKLVNLTTALMSISVTIGILSLAVKSLAELDSEGLVKGIIGVTVLLGELVGVTKLLSNANGDITSGIGKLILLAGAIDLLTIAVKTLGSMDIPSLAKGLISVGIILVELVAFAKLAGKANLAGVGLAMIPLAAGLDLLTIAVKVLGGMNISSLAKGIASIGLIFLELAGFSKLVSPVELLAIAASILPIATAMDILSVSVIALGTMNLASLAKGLGSIAVIFAELGVFSKLVNPVSLIGISAALLVFSAALVPFSASMAALSLLSWEGIIKGFVTLAGALTILGVASSVLAPIIPAMLGVGAALLLIGTAAMAAGAGVALIATSLITLAGLGVAGVAALAGTLTALAGLIPTMVHMLQELVSELLSAAIVLAPKFAETTLVIISEVLKSLAAHMPDIVKAGCDLIIGLLKGFTEKIPQIATVIGDFAFTMLTELGKLIPKLVDAGWKMIINFINGMADAIVNNTPLMINAVNNLMEAVVYAIGAWIGNFINGGADLTNALIKGIKSVDGPASIFVKWLEECVSKVKSKIEDIKQAARDFVTGFINGITGRESEVETAGAKLGAAADRGLRSKKGIDSRSPSKKANEAGGLFDEGFKKGIEDGTPGVETAAANMGDKAGKKLKESAQPYVDWVDQKTAEFTKLNATKGSESDANAAKQEQINARKKLAEATKEATAAEEDFGKAAKGGGKAAKEEKEEIKDLSKAFEAVAKSTKKTLSQISNNLAANLKETYSWAEDMKTFMAQTWDDTTKKWVESLGVAGHDTLRAFINATEEEAAVFKGLMPQYLTLDEDSKAMIAGNYNGLGLQIMAAYGEGIGLYSEELAENIQNAVKPFEAFNKELDVTKWQLMENLESQVKGVNEWADQLIELSNRAINENLLEYLRDMGPEGYKYVMAFGSMTDEELAKTNDLWQQTMNLGINTAKKLYPTQYNNLGKAITDGFDAGIDKNKMVGTIGNALDATVSKARAIYDWHSPSGLMLRMGQDIGRGFVDGINQIWSLSVIPTVTRVSEEVVNTFKMQFNDSTGRQLGTDITQGIVNGIRDREGDLYQTAWDIAYNAWQRAKEAVKSSSPSKRFAELGRNMDEGLIIGLKDKAEAVYSTTSNIGNNTVQMMNDIIKNITSEINDTPELQPVIRPRLDLTALQNGKRSINGMFGGSTISLANDVLANKMSADSINPTVSDSQIVNNQNFIFNQTNNSPKALDAYEIYRNSRNLLGQIKGAKA